MSIAGQVGQAIDASSTRERARGVRTRVADCSGNRPPSEEQSSDRRLALRLQARSVGDEAAGRALDESVNRILSIAAVHDLLDDGARG